MSYLNQKGITSGLMLNFMGPVANWMGGIKHEYLGLSDIRLVAPDTAASIGGFTPFFYELVNNPTVMGKGEPNLMSAMAGD